MSWVVKVETSEMINSGNFVGHKAHIPQDL